eukprot:1159497-Pelagomonas_calceolata.AAC.1
MPTLWVLRLLRAFKGCTIFDAHTVGALALHVITAHPGDLSRSRGHALTLLCLLPNSTEEPPSYDQAHELGKFLGPLPTTSSAKLALLVTPHMQLKVLQQLGVTTEREKSKRQKKENTHMQLKVRQQLGVTTEKEKRKKQEKEKHSHAAEGASAAGCHRQTACALRSALCSCRWHPCTWRV